VGEKKQGRKGIRKKNRKLKRVGKPPHKNPS